MVTTKTVAVQPLCSVCTNLPAPAHVLVRLLCTNSLGASFLCEQGWCHYCCAWEMLAPGVVFERLEQPTESPVVRVRCTVMNLDALTACSCPA